MAEIIYSDGRKESVPFLNPPAGEQEIRAPTAFEKYRSARQGLVETPLKAIGVPVGAAESVGEFLTPQTTAEQGIEIGTLMMPGVGKFAEGVVGKEVAPWIQRAVRYGLPAAGGFVGDIAGRGVDLGHNLWETARGLVYGLGGDILPASRGLWKHSAAIEKADEAAVGKAVEGAVPAFGKMATKGDLDAVAVRGRGTAALDSARSNMMDFINEELQGARTSKPPYTSPSGSPAAATSRLGGVSIDVPSLAPLAGGGSMTVKDAAGWLSKLSDQGWLLSNQLAAGMDASSARALREKARGEIVSALNASKKGLGDRFDSGMNELAKGHLFIDILQQPGVIADGKLNMNALRDVMGKMATQTQTYGERLAKLGSASDVKAFYDALSRGSGDLTARDVPGKFLKIGAHAGHLGKLNFWIGPGQFPKRVGTTPPISIGPGGTPTSLGLMGLSREAAESEQR